MPRKMALEDEYGSCTAGDQNFNMTHIALGLLGFILVLELVVGCILYRKCIARVLSAVPSAGARQVRSWSADESLSTHDHRPLEGPTLSDYNSNALIALRSDLKIKVKMKPLLIDMLQPPAGGFMNPAEEQSVRNAESPMEELIMILLGKGNKEFSTFCDMLEKSNHSAWASRLRQEAEWYRAKNQMNDVDPAYDVETPEAGDYKYLKKATKKATMNLKANPQTLIMALYHDTYDCVTRILANYTAQDFSDIMATARAAIILGHGDKRALNTVATVADVLYVLRVDENWKDTRLLKEIVKYLPKDARTAVAISLLDRYNSYLYVYEKGVSVQDLLTKDVSAPDMTRARIEVTVATDMSEFTCRDYMELVNLLLYNSWQCPCDEDIVDVQTGSTTVVFLIDKAFMGNIIQYSATASSLWAFQEFRVTRVRVGDFDLNVIQLLTQHFKEVLRGGLTGSMDFVGAIKALPYQVHALVDPDITEKLLLRTINRKIAQPYPEQEKLVSGTAQREQVESAPEMHENNFPPKVEEEAELDDEGKMKEATDSGELLSHVQELEDELKNSECKRMDLTQEIMALVNHLKVCQQQKDHTEQENASLKKRLVSMLSSQGSADKNSALSAPSDIGSKRPPHRWWLKVSAGSYDTSLLPSSPMKQAEGGREMEGEVVFRRDTKSNLLKAVSGTEWMYQRGALERGRRANLRQHQFTRYHRRWLADNVQEDDSCKLWLLQSSPEVGSVRERKEYGANEGKMSEEVTGSGELFSRVQELEDKLKVSDWKRMDLIQSNTALQKIVKACREQEDCAQQEIASLWERLGGADQETAPTAPSEGPLKRIPHRWWLKVSAGSYDTSLLPSSPMKQAESGKEMEGEVVFSRDTKSNLLKAVSGTEWMYRRGALERGRRHQFARYHRRWLADNVQKEEEESCKQWLQQSSPNVGSVREEEVQGLMSKVYKQALRDYQEKIAGVLIVKNIISDLEPYLTKVEYLQLKNKLGNMAQVDELFRILLTKGNRHFEGFCHILEDNGYKHWAQQLRSSTDGAETEGADQDSAPTAPSKGLLKRIPHRRWLKASAGSYDTSLLPSSPMKQAEGGREMAGEVVFRRKTKSNLLKAVSDTEWMYRRGALERGRQSATANPHRHQFTRYHQSWLADNVQKEEESCKHWLLQSSGFARHDCMDEAKRTVRQDIGSQWPDLARELGFSQSDIDDIKERERSSIYGQIFEMFYQWERRSDTGRRSVYELLIGLTKAVSSTNDENLRGIRDRVFTHSILASFPDKACAVWPQLAKVIELSRDDKRRCRLADPDNLKMQAYKFLGIWCTKSGWKILEELPVKLEAAALPDLAENAAQEIFSITLNELKQKLDSRSARPDPVKFDSGDAVKMKHLGVVMYGTLQWQGVFPDGVHMAGIEVENYSEVLGDGSHGGMEYFTCANGYGAFVHISGVQKDDRFGDTSLPASSSTTPFFALIQHLADGPPKLLIPGSQRSPQTASAFMRGVNESASTEVQPIQETHESLRPNASLPHSVVEDSPLQRTRSSPASTGTQQSPGAGTVGGHLGCSPPTQPSSSSGGRVDYGSAASNEPTSEEDHEIQPLLEVGDEHVYYLRFAGDLGGLIVGRGGSNVRIVEAKSHAKVHVMEKRPVTEDVRVLVVGSKERCMKAIELIREQLKHKTANLQKYPETIELTDAEAGRVVGQNGTTKQMIEKFSGAVLQVERRPVGNAGLLGVGNRKCKIYGSREEVEKAKSFILDIQQGRDISHLQLIFTFSQLLRSMPQGVSVQNHLDASEKDEVHSILGLL